MIERDLLLNATAAILLACLAWLRPGVARRFGRDGLVLFVAGALLPLCAVLLLGPVTADRIELMGDVPLVESPLYTLALIGVLGVLTASVLSLRAAAALVVGLAAGFLAHVVLAVLTPTGWPLLAPFSSARMGLPILPPGHVALLLVLFAALALAEGVPRARRWAGSGAALLAVAYLLGGAVQFAIVTLRSQALAAPEATVRVYPDGNWLVRWQIVTVTPDRYELRRASAFAQELPEPRTVPRWNDQALLVKLLGDPVVSQFYFRIFQHPVARLDVSGSQITLLMQELEDQSPPVPGPTFYLESDLSGRHRFYQLQRFN